MKHEVRFAIRVFRRAPLFALAVIATVALGIGMGSAVFSVVDSVLIRPLPYPEADRLVRVWGIDEKTDRRFLELSFRDFQFLREAQAFQAVGAFSFAPRNLSDEGGRASGVTIARITSDLLPLLGSPMERGRIFSPEEFNRQEAVAVISHELWRQRYGAAEDIVGRRIYIREEPHIVVGVLTAEAAYPRGADLWRPVRENEIEDDDREFFVVARLKSGVSETQATLEAAAIVRRSADGNPRTKGRFKAWVQPLKAMLVRDVRGPLILLLGAVTLVLLIACVNVANLLLARGTLRRSEMALRAALGAGRQHLAALCLAEGLVLALVGGTVGLLLGSFFLRALVALAPAGIPRLAQTALDGRVTLVMTAVIILCGLFFGLAPAWTESNQDPSRGLAGGRGTSHGGRGHRVRKGLVVAEVALSTVLLAGAGLLLTGFQNLTSFDRGFQEMSLLEVPVGASGNEYRGADRVFSLYDGIKTRLLALPGIASVEMANLSPMAPRGLNLVVDIEGRESGDRPASALLNVVTFGYFDAVGLPMIQGRSFSDETDFRGSAPVAIVNKAFVDAYLPDGRVIDRNVSLLSVNGGDVTRRIVGVVADLYPEVDSQSRPAVYSPYGQEYWPAMNLVLEVSGDPQKAIAMIREHIWEEAPTVTLDDIATLDERVERTLTASRFSATVVGLFATLALILASVGLYGVLAYFVSTRTRELAIRRAMGAHEPRILGLVLKQGIGLALWGIVLGLPLAFGLSIWLSSQLYQVSPFDPLTFILTTAVVVTVAAAACLLPALRALRIDPMRALREE